MKKTGLYIIITILLMVMASGATYIFLSNNPKNNPETKEPTKENDNEKDKEQNNQSPENTKPETITLKDEELKKYLGYVPFLGGTPVDTNYADAYSGTNNKIDTINKNILLYMAYDNVKGYNFEDIFRDINDSPLTEKYGEEYAKVCRYYKLENINKYVNNAFGISANYLPKKISVPGGSIFLEDDYYIVSYGAGALSYYKYTETYNYSIENDNLVIYENALFYLMDENSLAFVGNDNVKYKANYNIYKNTNDMHNMINAIGSFEYSYDHESTVDLSKYTNEKATKYKHIFKKNDTGYYWYSTEVVN